jgi:hypothetical protein
VAGSYTGVTIVNQQQDKCEEALEMHAKSLEIKTQIYGGDT